MTVRNRWHCQIVATLSHFLLAWLHAQPQPRGRVHSGEVGCILRHDPDTTVGIDVALFTAETMAAQTDETTLVDGPPLLAVEVLSPSDRQEGVDDKVSEYLAAGVAVVWVVNPRFRTVTVYRADAAPKLVNDQETLSGDPALPGFELPVARIFE